MQGILQQTPVFQTKRASFKLVHLAMTCYLFNLDQSFEPTVIQQQAVEVAVDVAVDVEWETLCDFFQVSGMLCAAGNAKVN